jgi:hypothetical protein
LARACSILFVAKPPFLLQEPQKNFDLALPVEMERSSVCAFSNRNFCAGGVRRQTPFQNKRAGMAGPFINKIDLTAGGYTSAAPAGTLHACKIYLAVLSDHGFLD